MVKKFALGGGMSLFLVLVLPFLCAFLAGVLLLWIKRRLKIIARPRDDNTAVQASHVGNPPRIGGAAIIVSFTFISALQMAYSHNSTVPLLLLSVLPVFFAGLAEDFGYHVSPYGRFLAAIGSAVAAVLLLGLWVPKFNIPGLDWAMGWSVIAIALTVAFSGGFCHAVNLIDGMNGLAASVITSAALGCVAIATLTAQTDIAVMAMSLAAATLGFLFLNWPFARLFLGDAGAYGLGHLVVWMLFMLTTRTSEVAAPALALVIFWPLADVTHTILRRLAVKVSIMEPDRMHLHQKVQRTLDIVWFGYRGRYRSNPLTTLILLPFIIMPVVTGVLLWNNPAGAWIALGAYMLAFSAAHPLTTGIARRFRI
jgi:UDP-GlcNAc:undecaprenyl-phosphate/decaprenyl-phosphate GlcNAc-1-phosphate transferase